MPSLKKIVIQNFRNIELQELEFSPNINCISGGNGEGKTNLLDAIWYLSMTKSAFASSDNFNFRYGSDSFSLLGQYELDNGTSTRIGIQVSKDSDKKLKRDDKACLKFAEHIGLLPIVMVSPADVSMVSSASEERRKFVNSVLSQMDRQYLLEVQTYNKYLMQRNKLLKAGIADEELLSTFDYKLAEYAQPIFEKRKTFCQKLIPIVQRYYSEISGGKEEVDIQYSSALSKASLTDLLKEHREQDRILKFTSVGVHRDDFLFSMGGHPIRRCGSQGQQKSFLVALKFAQYEVMKNAYGYAPILLLDDLFDKLDMNRVSNLLSMVSGHEFGQIFLSDSNKVRIESIVDNLTTERAYIETRRGVFTRVDE